MKKLSPAQRKHLSGMAHSLQPVVVVGTKGISEGVLGALEQALLDHELIKVKIGSTSEEERHQAADQLSTKSSSHLIKVIGKVVVLYRPHPDKPTIRLPRK